MFSCREKSSGEQKGLENLDYTRIGEVGNNLSVFVVFLFYALWLSYDEKASDEQREQVRLWKMVIWCRGLTIGNAFSDIINKIYDWK